MWPPRFRPPYIDEVTHRPTTFFIKKAMAFCNGAGPSGHPGVYVHLGREGRKACPYCGQMFQRTHPREM